MFIGDDLTDHEEAAQSNLMQALNIEEAFWKEKARSDWFVLGDRNMGFFHRTTKIRQATNSITILKDGDRLLTTAEEINSHVLFYFTDLFATNNVVTTFQLIQKNIPAMVTEADNRMLCNIPIMEEVK
ncbi:unnamed protein product [Lupinus luteus]|uniref:Uncharacterized protein n=1 Tax=Lupinus luteus TaxID=3873 RepID=A0AAV1YMB5_LUPLU